MLICTGNERPPRKLECGLASEAESDTTDFDSMPELQTRQTGQPRGLSIDFDRRSSQQTSVWYLR